MRETRTAAEKGEAKKRAARRRGMTLAEYEAMRARDRATRAEARAQRIRKQDATAAGEAAAAVAVAADEGKGGLDEIADRVLRQQLIAAEVRAKAGAPGPDDAALARTLAGRRVTQRQEISGPGGSNLFGAVIYLPRGAPELAVGEGGALEADFAELPSDATPAEGSVGQPEQGASGEVGEEG